MFFSIRLGEMPDGTVIQSSTKTDTREEALVKFHQDLMGYIGKAKRIFCFVADANGNIIARETWNNENH